MMSSAALPVENIPGIVKAIPGSGENRSPSRRNRCSPSARNAVRLHPGIVFTFAPESFSPCPGIRRRSIAGWLLTAAGALFIVAGVIANMHIYFQPTTLFNTILMLILLVGGLALIARALRPH